MNRNIHELLGRYLSMRARSEGEVRAYLRRKAVQYQLDEARIETLVTRYKASGLINDALFVEAVTHSMLGKGKGQAFIRRKLQVAQVDSSLIARGMSEPSEEDINLAMEKRLQRYARKWEGLDPKLKRQKAYTALFSSGFSSSSIRAFIDLWMQKGYNDPKL